MATQANVISGNVGTTSSGISAKDPRAGTTWSSREITSEPTSRDDQRLRFRLYGVSSDQNLGTYDDGPGDRRTHDDSRDADRERHLGQCVAGIFCQAIRRAGASPLKEYHRRSTHSGTRGARIAIGRRLRASAWSTIGGTAAAAGNLISGIRDRVYIDCTGTATWSRGTSSAPTSPGSWRSPTLQGIAIADGARTTRSAERPRHPGSRPATSSRETGGPADLDRRPDLRRPDSRQHHRHAEGRPRGVAEPHRRHFTCDPQFDYRHRRLRGGGQESHLGERVRRNQRRGVVQRVRQQGCATRFPASSSTWASARVTPSRSLPAWPRLGPDQSSISTARFSSDRTIKFSKRLHCRTYRLSSVWTGPGWSAADGPTHHGSFDMAYLRVFPNMVVMAPGEETSTTSTPC